MFFPDDAVESASARLYWENGGRSVTSASGADSCRPRSPARSRPARPTNRRNDRVAARESLFVAGVSGPTPVARDRSRPPKPKELLIEGSGSPEQAQDHELPEIHED